MRTAIRAQSTRCLSRTSASTPQTVCVWAVLRLRLLHADGCGSVWVTLLLDRACQVVGCTTFRNCVTVTKAIAASNAHGHAVSPSADSLKAVFKKAGAIRSARIAKKKDMKNPGKFLSMGFGFVEYATKEGATDALKTLQGVKLDGHVLELKLAKKGQQQQHREQTVSGWLVPAADDRRVTVQLVCPPGVRWCGFCRSWDQLTVCDVCSVPVLCRWLRSRTKPRAPSCWSRTSPSRRRRRNSTSSSGMRVGRVDCAAVLPLPVDGGARRDILSWCSYAIPHTLLMAQR